MGYRGEEIKEQMRHQQRGEQMCTATRRTKKKERERKVGTERRKGRGGRQGEKQER